MIHSNPVLGTFYHAVGGASASMCYLPNQKTIRWSWACQNGQFSVYQLGSSYVDADIFQLRCRAFDEGMEERFEKNIQNFDRRPITFTLLGRHYLIRKLLW